MLALYIFLGILAFLFLLLLIPVRLRIEYRDTLKIQVGYLFLRLHFSRESLQNKEPAKKKTEKPEDKQKNKFVQDAKDILHEKGLVAFFSYLIEILGIFLEKSKRILSHVKVKKFQLHLRFSGADAAETAVEYGALCALIYPALGVVSQMMQFQEYDIVLTPDMEREQSAFQIHFFTMIKLRPIFALVGLIAGLFEFLALFKRKSKSTGQSTG